VDSGGQTYLEMRRRLADYFDRRNCPAPDDLADETLNRIARRLEEEGSIAGGPAARYCYITAKFVFLEHVRRARREQGEVMYGEPDHMQANIAALPTDDAAERQRLLTCLERCLDKLPQPDRELILEYYRGEQQGRAGRRRQLAARLGLTMNAVSIRACRIRDTLEACIRACDDEPRLPRRRSALSE
jgi:RNA polymerase sigma factor (sigma-70 family)